MEIRVAKTAGFCFGVNRAVELTYGLLAEGHRVATLGPLIHNPQAVEDMQRKGAQVVDTVQDVPAGYEVVIRSHGVPRSVYDELTVRGGKLTRLDMREAKARLLEQMGPFMQSAAKYADII